MEFMMRDGGWGMELMDDGFFFDDWRWNGGEME